MKRTIRLALVILLTVPLVAQTITVGTQSTGSSGLLFNNTPPYTVIDLSHPAPAGGTLNYASVAWGGAGCAGAYTFKVFRPNGGLTAFTLVAERGPFTAQPARNQVSLTPPIQVQKGDLIGVTALAAFNPCGSPRAWTSTGSLIMRFSGDVSAGSFNGFALRDFALSARATDTQEVLEGVIPAVGSVAGANGSFFRTSLQIGCPGGGTCTGKLIFHPAGVAASPSDQAIPYTIAGGANMTSYDDVVQHMGKSGLGTMDVISNNGFPPLVTTRVYNDAGANGTSGFTEDMIKTTDVLHAGDLATLITPPDLTNYRMNIGVRTLSSPVTINIQYGYRFQFNKDFPANTFNQYSLAAFGDTDPQPNEQVFLFVLTGDAAVYASTTDNKTNDSAIRIPRRE